MSKVEDTKDSSAVEQSNEITPEIVKRVLDLMWEDGDVSAESSVKNAYLCSGNDVYAAALVMSACKRVGNEAVLGAILDVGAAMEDGKNKLVYAMAKRVIDGELDVDNDKRARYEVLGAISWNSGNEDWAEVAAACLQAAFTFAMERFDDDQSSSELAAANAARAIVRRAARDGIGNAREVAEGTVEILRESLDALPTAMKIYGSPRAEEACAKPNPVKARKGRHKTRAAAQAAE